MEKEKTQEKENKKKWLLLLLLLITIAAVGVSIWAIWFRDSGSVLAPDYAPKETEQNAQPIGDDNDEKLEQPTPPSPIRTWCCSWSLTTWSSSSPVF